MIPFEATPTGQKLFAAKNWFDRQNKDTLFELIMASGLLFGPPLTIVLSICF